MKIGVIVPVVHDLFINGLMDCIAKNSVIPCRIIIVDNSTSGIIMNPRNNSLEFELYRPPFSFGVNDSWNYGIKELAKDVDLISVLNDDLLIEEWFFEKLLRLAEIYGRAGVFCPETVNSPDLIEDAWPPG